MRLEFSSVLAALRLALCSLLVVVLASCGGGGYSGKSSQNVSAPSAAAKGNVSVEGMVVKGLLSNATVSLYEMDAAGKPKSTPTASTQTDASGHYRFDNLSVAGNLLLVVTAKQGSDKTLMACDSISGCGDYQFGDKFPVESSDFQLTAATKNIANASQVEANVTPLTHLAAQWAVSQNSGLNDSSIERATSTVESLFVLDHDSLVMKPVDLTSQSELQTVQTSALQHSIFSAAFLELAEVSNGVPNVAKVLNETTQVFVENNGSLYFKNSKKGVSVHDLTTKASEIATALNNSVGAPTKTELARVAGALRAMQAEIDRSKPNDMTMSMPEVVNVVPVDVKFSQTIWPQIKQDCTTCHSQNGFASATGLVFQPDQSAVTNLQILVNYYKLPQAKYGQPGSELLL
ncbi:MAG TPA: hypothetical protein VFM46_09240, partial [Pseudomonadales bacterium]|nr:hypothetical protein [Pseudomonadales bacterium]